MRYPHQYLWFYDRFMARHEAWTTSELNSKEQMRHGRQDTRPNLAISLYRIIYAAASL